MLVRVDTALRVVVMLVPAGKLAALKNRQESESQDEVPREPCARVLLLRQVV